MATNENTLIKQLLDTVSDSDNGAGQAAAKLTITKEGRQYLIEVTVTALDEDGNPDIEP